MSYLVIIKVKVNQCASKILKETFNELDNAVGWIEYESKNTEEFISGELYKLTRIGYQENKIPKYREVPYD